MNDEIALAISKSLEKIAKELEELNQKFDIVISYTGPESDIGYICTYDMSR